MARGELEEGSGTVRGNHRLARFQKKLPFIRNRTGQRKHTGLGKRSAAFNRVIAQSSFEDLIHNDFLVESLDDFAELALDVHRERLKIDGNI